VKAYRPPAKEQSPFVWNSSCQQPLDEIRTVIDGETWLPKLLALWTQESNFAGGGVTDVRGEHLVFVKSLCKSLQVSRYFVMLIHLQSRCLRPDIWIEPLMRLNLFGKILTVSNNALRLRSSKAYFEVSPNPICLITRLINFLGSKHWPTSSSSKLWSWVVPRLPRILSSITPDTVQIWESVFSQQLRSWDPRRNQPLIDFIVSLPLEFTGGSPFLSEFTLYLDLKSH